MDLEGSRDGFRLLGGCKLTSLALPRPLASNKNVRFGEGKKQEHVTMEKVLGTKMGAPGERGRQEMSKDVGKRVESENARGVGGDCKTWG
jgi:hypothetical protein